MLENNTVQQKNAQKQSNRFPIIFWALNTIPFIPLKTFYHVIILRNLWLRLQKGISVYFGTLWYVTCWRSFAIKIKCSKNYWEMITLVLTLEKKVIFCWAVQLVKTKVYS